jgi:predicted nucleotidyltransferase
LKDILVRDFKAKKVVLFGSCIRPQGFNELSDIDLAVENLAKARYFEALGALNEASPYSVDLKPLEEVENHLKEKIQEGIVLYEAGKNT